VKTHGKKQESIERSDLQIETTGVKNPRPPRRAHEGCLLGKAQATELVEFSEPRGEKRNCLGWGERFPERQGDVLPRAETNRTLRRRCSTLKGGGRSPGGKSKSLEFRREEKLENPFGKH